nr:MAG TPA: hypothetical protein [Caudoviricetes sp.]
MELEEYMSRIMHLGLEKYYPIYLILYRWVNI